jgi:peptidoglycan/LPS O-acetylase OafA/YrhL
VSSGPLRAFVRGTDLFWSGVDLFFVLSGFLIAGILIDSAQSKDYFKTFYLRRIHRIFPLYFGWLALFYLGTWLDLDGKLGVQIFRSSVPLWLYPVFLQNNASLWFHAQASQWMAMSWSLAVEEQFYLVLPAIVRFANKVSLAYLCGAVILLSPLSRAILFLGSRDMNDNWEFSSLSRLDGLAMGVAVALLVRNESWWLWLNRHLAVLRLACAGLFLGFFALTYLGPSELSMALYGFTGINTFYAVVLLNAICLPASHTAGLLRAPVLRYFGRISYAVYIFHAGVRGLIGGLIPKGGPGFNGSRAVIVLALSLGVTVMLAEISWRLVERRLIGRAHVRYKY